MHALLVIDVQQALIRGAYREQEVLASIGTSINRVRAGGGLVVFLQHCHTMFEPMMRGKPGWQLHASLNVQPGDPVIEKEASDSFYGTNLKSLLDEHGVDHVLITGLQTEYCVDATCRSALSKGYAVTLISDAHTTGDSTLTAKQIIAHHNAVLSQLAHPDHTIELCRSTDI